jgi:SAM-dependent methyltransferase
MICPICSSKNIKLQKAFRNNHSAFSNLNRVACNDCGLHFANPMPEIEKLIAYNNSYHDSAHGGSDRDLKQQAFFLGLAKTRLDFIAKQISLEKDYPYKILEIGPGPGAFVKVWMDCFTKSQYFVLESDESCHKGLKKIGAKIIYSKDEKIAEKYDFIFISHVLEHVTEPICFLESFVDKMKKGGLLFVEVPCMDFKHKSLDEPHLLFFDKKPMEVLLKRLKLTKLKIAYYGIPHQHLKNPIRQFFKRLRGFLWRKGIIYYHPESQNINSVVKDDLQTQALLNFDAHKEHFEPAWWLRVLYKKQ